MTSSLKRIIPAAACLAAVATFALIAGAQDGAATKAAANRTTTPSGLTIIDQGRNDMTVQANDNVTVHYTGKLENGTVFDSSLTRGEPFKFQVGVSRVIKGWQEGLIGMKVGDRRQLIIPSSLGYGDAGNPPTIPGGATLVFDIELLYITRPAK